MEKSIEQDTISVIKEIVGDKYKSEIVGDTDLVSELFFDSITIIRLVIALQKKFKINISEYSDEIDFTKLKNVSDVVAMVEKIFKIIDN